MTREQIKRERAANALARKYRKRPKGSRGREVLAYQAQLARTEALKNGPAAR